MKKTVRWTAAAVIFLLIGLVLFGRISEVLRKKTGDMSDMIHSLYGIEENTVDVLCMGSSHGYSSFQPNVLWNEYGVTSYVMCSHRQTVTSTYYLLKEALNYQKPKVLFLETYFFFTNKKYIDEASLRFAFDGIRLGKVKHEMISDVLANKSFKIKLSYYIPFLKYHGRWEELENSDFNSKSYLKGSIFDFTVYQAQEPELPEGGEELPETVTVYLEKIIELCKENQIELILYTAPYSYTEKEKEEVLDKLRFNTGVWVYCEEHDIPYFDFQRITDAGIDWEQDFRDYAHMNTNGASKITRYLGAYLQQNYEMTDHRDDEKFQSWERDYQLYAKAVAKEQG